MTVPAECASPTWLDTLKMEAENLSHEELIEPQSELEDGEYVVGALDSEALKKYFTLAMRWNRDSQELVTWAAKANDPNSRDEDIALAAELRRKSEVLFDIFWTSLKDMYGLWGWDAVGIRRGWKVVYKKETPAE